MAPAGEGTETMPQTSAAVYLGEGHDVIRHYAQFLLLASSVTVLSACSGGAQDNSTNARTVGNFCSRYTTDKADYLTKYNAEAKSVSTAQQQDPLVGLLGLTGMSLQMLGSVEQIFDDLATVAPSDIQPQVEQVRDSIKKQEDQLSQEDPASGGSIISTLLGSLETGLESSGSWQQVGTYIEKNCEGGSTPTASTPPTEPVSTPASTTVPSPGTTLTTVQGDGRVNVISNAQGQGFTVVDSITDGDDDESFLQTYDAAGNPLAMIPPGSLTGECGAADVINGEGRIILAEKIDHQDAQGLQQASDTLTLAAYDATSGKQMWTTTLVSNTTNGISCSAYDGYLGSQAASSASTFNTTLDGHWGVYQPDDRNDLSDSVAIDLTTGKTYPKPGLYGTVGNWVTVAKLSTYDDSPESLTLTTPGSWPTLGTLTLGDGGMLYELQGSDTTLVAPGAQFPTNDVDSPTAAAITPDGTTLIGVTGDYNQGGPTATVAYSLPSMTKLWSIATPQYSTDSVGGINNSMVVLTRTQNGGDDTTHLMAVNIHSGAKFWQQDVKTGASVCALTTTQLVVLANGQLAFLDTSDGHQTSYEADNTQDSSGDPSCPGLLSGGVSGVENDNGTIAQLATP